MSSRHQRALARRGSLLLAASLAVLPLGGCGGSSGSDRTATRTEVTTTTAAGATPSPTTQSPTGTTITTLATMITSPEPGPVALHETVEGTGAAIPPPPPTGNCGWSSGRKPRTGTTPNRGRST